MKSSGFDYINVIPLVDVMLVLLTIVLTTSTFIAAGAIPVELGDLENLYALYLSHNQLSSAIPLTFANLSKLDELDLS